ncbi:hypothetical protein [Paracoccus marcusii]|nr:hypothetical protein [Paracoccus marcusii]
MAQPAPLPRPANLPDPATAGSAVLCGPTLAPRDRRSLGKRPV